MTDAKDSDLVNGLLALAGSDDLDHFVAMQIKHAAERIRAKDELIERQSAEIDRLRKLDAEYGTVEAAIIMVDPRFDGDSDHPSCGARLIASVNRMGKVYQRSLSNKGKGDE